MSDNRAADAHQSRVYRVENRVGRLLREALRSTDTVTVTVDGVAVPLPLEKLFADLASMQRYVDAVLASGAVTDYAPGEVAAVTVVERPGGEQKADYQPASTIRGAQIRIPMKSRAGAWARRQLVVNHELAHHLAAHTAPAEEPSHGPTFCRWMVHLNGLLLSEAVGQVILDGLTAECVPVADPLPALRADSPMGTTAAAVAGRTGAVESRVAKLLHQATRTTGPEADAFLAKAQELAMLHTISMEALAVTADDDPLAQLTSRQVTVATARTDTAKPFVSLFSVIAESSGLRLDVAYESSYVIAYGRERDIAHAEDLFERLSVHMTTAAVQFVEQGTWKGDTYNGTATREEVAWNGWVYRTTVEIDKKYTARTARLHFYDGYTRALRDRLRQANADAVRAADEAAPSSDDTTATNSVPPSAAVVLARRDELVTAFYQETTNARGRYRGFATSGAGSATRAGRAAAANAALHRTRAITR